MSTRVLIAEGVEGETVAFGGEVLELLAARAFAPGAPMVIEVLAPEESFRVEGKSRGSRRQPDGRFTVRVRMTSLRREHREALLALHTG